MFGWGKKSAKKVEQPNENGAGIGNGARSDGPAKDFPACVYVAIAQNDADISEITQKLEARASLTTGCKATSTAKGEGRVGVTLLVEPGGDGELVFLAARAGGLGLATAIEGLAQLYIVRCDKDGKALESFLIEPEKAAPVAEDGFDRLVNSLGRSSAKLVSGVAAVFTTKKLDDAALDELEELLILSDMGAANAAALRAKLSKDRFGKETSAEDVRAFLAEQIEGLLAPYETHNSPFIHEDRALTGPRVIVFVGVNGSGKTTAIGKIAHQLTGAGHKLMLAAGDTFRAAAVEQLKVWGQRANVPVISGTAGADAAGLAFDAVDAAIKDNVDVLLIDTAGRLQNKTELMAELTKIIKVLGKRLPDAPHEVWLVLDATVGQNALSQAQIFSEAAGITGLIMNKLDGTAKGGVLLAVTAAQKLPVRFIGVGEGADDLRPFSARAFSRALVGLESNH